MDMGKWLTPRRFLTITILLVVIKSLVGALAFRYEADKLAWTNTFKTDFGQPFSSDETEMVRSAFYYNKYGKIYTDSPFHSFNKPRLRDNGIYLTAFRPKANIYVHVLGLKIAEARTGHLFKDIGDIPKWYLHAYGVFMFLLKTLIFPFSVFFFYKILRLLNISKPLQMAGTWGYILIPSVFLFIGWFDYWENISLYLFVIIFYYAMAEHMKMKIRVSALIIVPILAVIAAVFRPHLLLFCAAIFGFIMLNRIWGKECLSDKLSHIRLSMITIIFMLLCHLPIFTQNQSYFSKYMLSTQSYYEFFQGHNPFARGSWYPAVYDNNKPYFDSLIAMQHINNPSELAEGEFYRQLSIDWIKANPLKEVELAARKVAGYFLPYNFLNHRINIYTLILHLSFFVFSIWFVLAVFRRKFTEWEVYFLVALPALTSIFITVLFFTGERWRFYAEPFFLMMALLMLDKVIKRKNVQKEPQSQTVK